MSYVETASLKNSTIMLLYSERDEIETSPEYQRAGGVWTLEKKRLLIDSILNDYDIPKIYFHAYKNEQVSETGKRYAIIDGRQRLETIWGFLDGEFTLSGDFEYQKDPSVDLSGMSYDHIAKRFPKIRIKFDSFVLPVVTVTTDGEELDVIEDMFSRLNEAVPLNAAEKRNAIGGELVKAINKISGHGFFTECVRFSNRRYQHREAAARFLLVEDSLKEQGRLIDTKKVYLDRMASDLRDNAIRSKDLRTQVKAVLDRMNDEFVQKDDLLTAQGSMVIYYLLFKSALENQETEKVTRRKLIDFRDLLAANRHAAENDYAEASFELLEYDRLNQQGTNDASSIRERFRILAEYVGLKRTEY